VWASSTAAAGSGTPASSSATRPPCSTSRRRRPRWRSSPTPTSHTKSVRLLRVRSPVSSPLTTCTDMVAPRCLADRAAPNAADEYDGIEYAGLPVSVRYAVRQSNTAQDNCPVSAYRADSAYNLAVLGVPTLSQKSWRLVAYRCRTVSSEGSKGLSLAQS